MVAEENDDRVVRELQPVQRIEQAAHLRVHERHAREISLHEAPAVIVGKLVESFFQGRGNRERWRGGHVSGVAVERETVLRVKVEVFSR